jgi:hypothetical protein
MDAVADYDGNQTRFYLRRDKKPQSGGWAWWRAGSAPAPGSGVLLNVVNLAGVEVEHLYSPFQLLLLAEVSNPRPGDEAKRTHIPAASECGMRGFFNVPEEVLSPVRLVGGQ